MFTRRTLVSISTVLVCGAATSHAAAAQSVTSARPRYAVGVVAGVTQFDLSGTGTAALVGARLEAELLSWLVAEGALGTFRPDEQFGERRRYAVPEAQLQAQLPLRTIRPYLGVGAGSLVKGGTEVTVSGAVGVRAGVLGRRADLRGELRVRGIGEGFTGSAAEWTLSLAYRF